MDIPIHNVLDDNRVGRLMLKLALPAFFGMFVMSLYNVMDTIFIGHFIGPLGIAGLSIVFPLQMLSIGMGQMTGMGGASVISRLIGAGNNPRAEHALGNAITINIVLSSTLMIAGLSNSDFWLRLVGASETILPYAREYMRIILVGMIFESAAMSINNLVRAEGNARVPMIGMMIGFGLNIILDAVFIIALDMGIKGAALATVIAQSISLAYFISYYLSGKSFLKVRLGNLIPELSILKEILAIGIASFARTIAGSLSAIFVNRALGNYGGDLAVSAFGIANRLMMFTGMPGMSIGQGLQPVLGFNYGAKHYDRALKSIKIAITSAVAFGIAAFLVIYFSPELFIRIFTNDSQLIAMAAYGAKRIFLAMYFMGFVMVSSIIFQSVGKAVQSFITAVSRSFLFLLPLILVLPHFWQLDGVWLAFPITEALTFLLTLTLLIPQIREFRRMNAE